MQKTQARRPFLPRARAPSHGRAALPIGTPKRPAAVFNNIVERRGRIHGQHGIHEPR